MSNKTKPIRIEFTDGEEKKTAYPQIIENSEPAQLWREAQDVLRELAILVDAPDRSEVGYDKTDFVVTFEYGIEYRGRFDLRSDGLGDDCETLLEHIRDNIRLQAGLWEPQCPKMQEYKEVCILARTRLVAEAKVFMEEYDLGECLTPAGGDVDFTCSAFGLEERVRSHATAEELEQLSQGGGNRLSAYDLVREVANDEDAVEHRNGETAMGVVATRLDMGMVPDPPDLHPAKAEVAKSSQDEDEGVKL